jgi:hypothetical protein
MMGERKNSIANFSKVRRGELALLRDLHDLWLLATEAQICWTLLALGSLRVFIIPKSP